MTEAEIRNVMSRVPQLTNHGMGTFERPGMSLEERDANFERDRYALAKSTEECTSICHWIETQRRRKTINRNMNSYGLKHMAERDVGYITNGQFIAAAIHCGLSHKTVRNSPNVFLNLSVKGEPAM